jgi:hypothetical protein
MPNQIENFSSALTNEGPGAFADDSDVIVFLFGRTGAAQTDVVKSAFARALIPIALLSDALIVDDGDENGLAGLLGQAIDQVDQPPATLGILAAEDTPRASNHTKLVPLTADGPNPDKQRFLFAAGLAAKTPGNKKLCVALLIGGCDSDKQTALLCAQKCWPILVVQGAGGLGDAVLLAKDSVDSGGKLSAIMDPDIRDIVDCGIIRPIDFSADTDTLKRLFLAPIQRPGDVLADMWARYDDLDLGAIEKQKWFRRNQITILALTVLATLMAIALKEIQGLDPKTDHWVPDTGAALHIVMIVIPILISVLVGMNARFRDGNKWVLLRAAAESVKQHVFRYRTKSGAYSEDQCKTQSASTELASNIRDITSNLGQSEANRSSLRHQPLIEPDRNEFLTAEEYLNKRIDDQINYFERTTRKLYRQLLIFQTLILLAGGAGTFLAAVHQEIWVALATALATAMAAKLELDQVENSLVQYNTALMSLRNIKSWWKGLSPWEKTRQKNIDLLVDQTETTLEHETAGWVQKMQSTLEKLTEKESGADHKPDQKDDQKSDQKQGQNSDQKPDKKPDPDADAEPDAGGGI